MVVLKKIFCRSVFIISVLLTAVLGTAIYMEGYFPDTYSVVSGEEIFLNYPAMISPRDTEISEDGDDSFTADITILGSIYVKEVQVNLVEQKEVCVSGQPFGIKMFTDGLMIVGSTDISVGGERFNPAKTAGLRTGDILQSINGVKLTSNEELGSIVQSSGGKLLQITYIRNGSVSRATVQPLISDADGKYRIGIWVRDSSAGIGTLTYYDENTGIFTGLGHAVCDIDTGALMPLLNGEAVTAEIIGCKRSEAGAPGELKGKFSESGRIGYLISNSTSGIYGAVRSRNMISGRRMPVAMNYEIKTGEAVILTTVEGTEPQEYDIQIEKIMAGDSSKSQNMVIRITDSDLLEVTGGIVQGMSGSPIIQNGKLIGAVTHVFVNDPTRGYGIFIENMLAEAEKIK